MNAAARIRRSATAALVCAAVLVPVGLGAPSACAGEDARAALVVDSGQRVRSLCVELLDGSVSGIELIELAAEQHGLDYALGFGGAAVCRLDGVGVDGGDCFAEFPLFWGYWRGDGSGGWEWSSVGAGSTTVEPGDVEGWSWGEGADGQTHPAPPETAFEDACPEQGPSPEPSPAGEDGGGGAGGGSGGSGGGGDGSEEGEEPQASSPEGKGAGGYGHEGRGGSGDGPEGAEGDEGRAHDGDGSPSSDRSPEAEPVIIRASSASSGGSSAGSLAALLAVGVLSAAALVLGRRRRSRG